MNTALDCIPCFVKQSLNVARLMTADEQFHERIVREVLLRTSRMDLTQPPPVLAQSIHRQVCQLVGQADPYITAKQESNRLALALLPGWEERIRASANPRQATVRLAIAANIIDFGIKGDLTAEDIPAALDDSFAGSLEGNIEQLFEAVAHARDILFLADNAGELVFDRLLLGLLPREKITVVVKGGPAINDALAADAEAAGLCGWIAVIDNGSDATGSLLESCSEAFRHRFARADLIIAKGQANYESLDGCDQEVFFLFKVKCPVVARHIGHRVGSLVIHRNVPTANPAGGLRPASLDRKDKPTRETQQRKRN
jgi:damage-control phosphatase, subfamily I